MRSSLPQAKERQERTAPARVSALRRLRPKLVVVIRARVTPPSLESSKPRLGRLEPQVLSLRRLSLNKNGSRLAAALNPRLSTILAGATKKHKVLLIQLHKDGKTRVPGRVGNLLQFRQGTITQINSTKEKCPQPVGMPTAGVAIKPLKMAVVYFRIPKLFLTEDGWKKLSHQPARAVAAWAASHHITLADSWGWVEEKAKGNKLGLQMFGCGRCDCSLGHVWSGRHFPRCAQGCG